MLSASTVALRATQSQLYLEGMELFREGKRAGYQMPESIQRGARQVNRIFQKFLQRDEGSSSQEPPGVAPSASPES
jgi:hypothetical protein